jgi:hypothetical protein
VLQLQMRAGRTVLTDLLFTGLGRCLRLLIARWFDEKIMKA